jgi:hypothetical protein
MKLICAGNGMLLSVVELLLVLFGIYCTNKHKSVTFDPEQKTQMGLSEGGGFPLRHR